MTKEEILEGNKLIAEFMQDIDSSTNWRYVDGRLTNGVSWLIPEYHTSWDWLMPCIGKISNKCEEPEELDGLKYALLTNNIEEAWISCIEFIKWYNEKLSE